MSFFNHTAGPYQAMCPARACSELTIAPRNEHFNLVKAVRAVAFASFWGPAEHRNRWQRLALRIYDVTKEIAMNSTRQKGGLRPVAIRPEIPRADYHDEISPEAFEKLKDEVADINDPKRKRTRISGFDWPFAH